jgi:hypothetical protein
MEGTAPLTLALIAGGMVLLVGRLVPLLWAEVNAPAFDAAIEKLLRAGNPDRARKLCQAAPRSAHVAVVRALLERSAAHAPRDGEHLIRESLQEVCDREIALQSRRARRLGWMGPLGLLTVAAGLFHGATGDPPPPPQIYVALAIAVPLTLAGYTKIRRLERQMREGVARLLPLAMASALERSPT